MPSSSSSRRRMPSLPAGFRFHPTDEELIVHYLMNQAASIPCPVPIIAEVNIYHHNPWDLPPKALFGDKEWYFFSPRDRKYPNGARPNRAAGSGYWKATGTDKAITLSSSSAPASGAVVGVKKALVFYRGKPPRGVKTDWIMHEYRLTDTVGNNKNTNKRRGSSMRLDDWVLCRIYKKSNDFQLFSDDQEQEERSTVEEDTNNLKSEEAAHASADHQFFPPPSMTKSCSLTDLLNTIDYSTLSQLLLDAPAANEPEPAQQQSPLIYTTPEHHQLPLNNVMNSNNSIKTPQQVDASSCSDYGSPGYSSLKRKRIMTVDGASSLLDDGTGLKRKLQLPSDSRSSSFLGSSSSSYRNQQQQQLAAEPSVLINQQLLFNNHQYYSYIEYSTTDETEQDGRILTARQMKLRAGKFS